MEKMIALVYRNNGDDYANHEVYLIPQSKFSKRLLDMLNDRLTAHGVWLEELPITTVKDWEELEVHMSDAIQE
jgi:hypothetical protein